MRDTLYGGEEGDRQEKVSQIRVYSGSRYRALDEAPAGTVCAVTGLTHTRPGDALGEEPPAQAPELEPVLTYQVILPEGCDSHTMLGYLRQLEEEDPQLRVVWSEALGEIHLQLMGEVQLEVMTRLIRDRFGVEVTFGKGNIVYRETIAAPVEGVGHFEPLRHYAEVQLPDGAGPPGEWSPAGHPLSHRSAGSELATAGADPSGGAPTPGGAHRLSHH